LVDEALRQGGRFEAVLGESDFWRRRPDLLHRLGAAGIPAYIVTSRQLEILSLTENPAGSAAVIRRPQWRAEALWETSGRAAFMGLLAVALQDPGNLGALLRTLAAAGGSGAWLGTGCAEAASPKLLRASAGTALRLPVLEQADPQEVLRGCRERGIQTLAAVPRGGRPYTVFDLTVPFLLVLGNEGGGLKAEWIRACDHHVHVPMPGGTESLNVGIAGSIILYEGVRQRRQAATRNREDTRARTAEKNR